MDIKEHGIFTQNLLRSLGTDEKTQLIETHISTIILSGDLAYKLKKPVDFGFLDYSTLEKRYKNSLEEVRINEGFAPELYLGVIPITGSIEDPRIDGEGRVLDHAVKMRRFEQNCQLDNMVDEGRLDMDLMDKAAQMIAAFHKRTEAAAPQSEFGAPVRVLAPMEENFELLKAVGSFQAKIDVVERWTYDGYKRFKPLLKSRKENGFIRECHGDMHLHNMAMFEGKLIMFDAIEFNPYLNHIDVISDLAFLLMDLEYRSLHQLSRRVLNRYLELTGDYEGVRVLDFYKTYRAMVRAKVAALRASQDMLESERQSVMDEVERYIDLALSYTREKEPFMAITHGCSGSGKSTFAQMLVETHGALRIRSDAERMRMFERSDESGLEEGIYTPDTTKATYERLLELAVSVYEAGYSVIVDATFLKQWQRRLFIEHASTAEAPFCLFTMACDHEVMRSRVEHRSEEGSDISEADLEVLQLQIKSAEPLSESEREVEVTIDCSSTASMRQSAARIMQ
ncbi:MAG: AAA family ATPase [Campylobacterota bacterium]|nr:AAA family ATPase [Campylobacterota bacterium]